MANYLKFDIYDQELSGLRSNVKLRRLLVTTANQSILVVEDIGCTMTFQDRSCGDEQIIVFPTNHKERLDPAVLHPGHMNVEVPILYCIPCGFRLLSANYLKINRHELFNHIESLLETARVTPAEVTEQLLKSDEPEVALRDMVIFLVNHKRKENDEVVKKKVCQCQLVEENGASVEESRKCKLIEE
ncbi:AAA-ATPase At3g50940 [Eucalyptus grandis]|uniref:AAA-ATPase At3g50940 n=1 Tax=Eucalyptus grandis TaxID=71139 RepID=UPI00192EDC21|nr:AAA-ATPase At3g50940 [Eucalyptus grandis]